MIVSDASHGAFTRSNVYVAQMASKYALHASNSYILIYRVYCNIRCTKCNLLQRIYRNIFASIYCIIQNVPIN